MMAAPLRILLVDDEPLAIERLAIMLARRTDVTVAGTATSGAEAIAAARTLAPDLCFLDIAIPDLGGIEIAQALAELADPPLVAFVTAYDHFAVAAFRVEAIDYLVKPVAPDELDRAIERAVRARREGPRPRQGLSHFWVPATGGLRRVEAGSVQRITAERDYMRLHVDGHSWLINDSLSRLEAELDPDSFLRVHRGAIVNRHHVRGLRHDDAGWIAIFADGGEQRISRGYADAARTLREP